MMNGGRSYLRSTVVEVGCKVPIGTRLKRAGMHWTMARANTIIVPSCGWLSGQPEGVSERWGEAEQAA